MKLKDLHMILDFALKRFNEFPAGLRLDGMTRALNSRELIAASYYMAVLDYLIKSGVLPNDVSHNIMLIQSDSTPPEEDYE